VSWGPIGRQGSQSSPMAREVEVSRRRHQRDRKPSPHLRARGKDRTQIELHTFVGDDLLMLCFCSTIVALGSVDNRSYERVPLPYLNDVAWGAREVSAGKPAHVRGR
jgi:hypothetical protein